MRGSSVIVEGRFCGADLPPGTFHAGFCRGDGFPADEDIERRLNGPRSTVGEQVVPIVSINEPMENLVPDDRPTLPQSPHPYWLPLAAGT